MAVRLQTDQGKVQATVLLWPACVEGGIDFAWEKSQGPFLHFLTLSSTHFFQLGITDSRNQWKLGSGTFYNPTKAALPYREDYVEQPLRCFPAVEWCDSLPCLGLIEGADAHLGGNPA